MRPRRNKLEYRTKFDIILFLANGDKNREDILSYVKQKRKIKENRGIDKHLRDLEKEGLIARHPENGLFSPFKPRYFKLNNGYDSFKTIVERCSEQDRLFELMDSQYFKNVVNIKLFYTLLDDFVSLVRRGIREIFIAPLSKELIPNYLPSKTKEDSHLKSEQKKAKKELLTEMGFSLDRENAINIIKTSPSALQFIVNDIGEGIEFFSPTFRIEIFQLFESKINKWYEDKDIQIKLIYDDIFNSFLVLDVFVYKKYIRNEFVRDFLKRYFTENGGQPQ